MNLDINGIRLTGRRFGVGRYIEYLLRCWDAIERPFDEIRVLTPGELDGTFELPAFVDHRIVRTRLPNAYWEQVVLPRRHRASDLLFCPSYVAPLAARGKLVVTHLGSYEAIPSAFPWHERLKTRLLYQASARKADLVITVSESSKADIVKYYDVAPAKIEVIPLGVDPKFRPLGDSFDRAAVRARYFGTDRPYVLFVGKLTRRRNIPELIGAFARLRAEHGLSHGLLLIGADTGDQDVPRLASESDVADVVVHREYEDHDALVEAYNAADLFVYPSSYEGFGIPVLESMACGTPTITLRNTAFLEFASGAYLCENATIGELYRGMETVLSSKELTTRLEQEGIARSKDFLWEGIARRTLNALADVARS